VPRSLCKQVVVGLDVLQVHVWTLRNEDRYLAWDFKQDFHNAYKFYMSHQVDGMFTDFSESLVNYLDQVYCDIGVSTKAMYWTLMVAGVSLVVI